MMIEYKDISIGDLVGFRLFIYKSKFPKMGNFGEIKHYYGIVVGKRIQQWYSLTDKKYRDTPYVKIFSNSGMRELDIKCDWYNFRKIEEI